MRKGPRAEKASGGDPLPVESRDITKSYIHAKLYLMREWNNYEGIFTLLSGPTIRSRDGAFSIGYLLGRPMFQLKLTEFNFSSHHKSFTVARIFDRNQKLPGPTFAPHVRHPKFCILSLFIQLTTNKSCYLSKGGGNNPYDDMHEANCASCKYLVSDSCSTDPWS